MGIIKKVNRVRDTKRPLVITQHGKGVAMLIDVAEHEAMQEKIELFEDVQTSIAQLNAGNGVEHNAAKSAISGRITK